VRYTLALILGLGGCASRAERAPADERKWSHALARTDCAPWDGPAVSVDLSDAPLVEGAAVPPFLRLALYLESTQETDADLIVGELRPGGASASWCPAEGECLSAASGVVHLTGRQGGDTLSGRYQLVLPDGDRLRGRFTAPRERRRILCG
jgi:hypothetical protein